MKQPPQQSSSMVEEMGSAEEVIKAFLDYLVDPLLPLKPPSSAPSLSNQQKVAKQMHAVVLLYNYYQRKRHARAEFLDFMSFCRLVVTLRPVLAAYMTSTERPVPTDSENLENQLSVAQKAIEDACKISTSLDVSRDIPDVKEWVVSKVAVFLVNPSKESCTLSFSSLTDGVWSIFEKRIDQCVDNQENQTKSRNLDKKKRKRRPSTGEPDLQQLAFSALKEARGIEQSHLRILERHVTYSLDKERTSACCFIMECRSTNQEFEFSVRDIIESLQGPLVKKISGNWTLTQLIEYYNVLPYAGIMSSWFLRQCPLISSELLNASYDFANAKIQENDCENMRTQSKDDSTDVESDKTYDDDNLAKSKYTESRVDCDHGPESENVEAMDMNLSGKPSGAEVLSQGSKKELMAVNFMKSDNYSFANANAQEDACDERLMRIQGEVDEDVESDGTLVHENLPKSKSNKGKSDSHNLSKGKNYTGLDVNLSGMVSDTEILIQRSDEESMAIDVIESKKFVCPFDREANVKSSGKNPDDNVKIVQHSSKGKVPEETCERLHSENDNNPVSVSNSMGEEVGSFNSFERPAKKVKDLVKSHDVAESSPPCKTKTNPLVLCDRKVLQLESSGPYVDDIQETRGTLTNEGNSTIISLLGDDVAESKLKSDERLAKEKDLILCKSDSRCESKSGLLRSSQDLQLNSGYIDEDTVLGKGNLPSEISATIISQTTDTDDVRSDKPDPKLIDQKDFEYATTDKKRDLGLASKKPSKCEKIDSASQSDVRMPITDPPSFPSGKRSDDSPMACPKKKDENLSTKSIIVYNAKRKRFRNHDARAPTGCENTEKETAKGEKSCNTECQDKTETNRAIMPFNLQGTQVADPTINPLESVHGATNYLLSVMALKETELSQTALGVLLQKKQDLCHQQQEIQDQIALCDQSIQKILDGNENSLVLKIDTLINCCNDFLKNKTEVQCNSYDEGGDSGTIQSPRPETIFKPFPSIGSAYQESDNRNANYCAPAGQYMSSSSGNVLGGVDGGEMDFKCSGEGTRFSSPHEMESAASEMTAAGETMEH
ncbi:hypothetical protein LIER_04452 [Lithospermum erythrorhizon]|uniref:Uncharacterized protein n=1 Tax=Lithospermum erythrorhizon TaxID=34254 RepID=A0AAV3NZJ8_LITER